MVQKNGQPTIHTLDLQRAFIEATLTDTVMQKLRDQPSDKMAEAMDWTRQRLSSGQEVESKQLENEAAENGIASRTFRRAKTKLGVNTRKGRQEESGTWFVSLKEEGQRE